VYGSDVVSVEVRVPGRGPTGSGADMATGINITTFKNSDVEAIAKLDNVAAYYSFITSQEIIKYEGENDNSYYSGLWSPSSFGGKDRPLLKEDFILLTKKTL